MTNPSRRKSAGATPARKGRGGRGAAVPPQDAPDVVGLNDDKGRGEDAVDKENKEEQAGAPHTPPQQHVWRPDDDLADNDGKKSPPSKADEEEEDGTVFRTPRQPAAGGASGKKRKRKRGANGQNKKKDEERRSEEGGKTEKQEKKKEQKEESEDEGTTVRRAEQLVAARKSEEKEQEEGPCSSAQARARSAEAAAAAASYRPCDPASDSKTPFEEVERLLWKIRRANMAWGTVNYTILTQFPDLAKCPPESASPFVFTSNRGRERLQANIDTVTRRIAAGRTTRSKREQAAKRKRAELNKLYGDRVAQLRRWLKVETARDEELMKKQEATAARPAAAQ